MAGLQPVPTSRKPQTSNLPSWEALTASLRAQGHFPAHFDAQQRIKLPHSLRKALGALTAEPWILSAWSQTCLRLVPSWLWTEYRAFLDGALPQENLQIHLEEIPVEVRFDPQFRVRVPSGIGSLTVQEWSKSEAIIHAKEAWIEIWEADFKKRQLQELLNHPLPDSQTWPAQFNPAKAKTSQ